MAKIDENYFKILNKIIKEGFRYEDPERTGVFRIQLPSYNFRHEFKDGFPVISTKKIFWKGIVGELIWFLRGETNIKYLNENNIHIWDKDASNFSDSGDLGRIYGAQWREWRIPSKDGEEFKYIDQIERLIKNLKTKPLSTEHIVTAWNPGEIDKMALPPCHWSFQILVEPLEQKKKSSFITTEEGAKEHPSEDETAKYGFTLKWNQRSVDTFLGLPFNIASYALLSKIIGELTNMIPLAIEGNLCNVHLYEPHMKAVQEQMNRSTKLWNSKTNLLLSPSIKDLCTAFNVDDLSLNMLFNGFNIKDFALSEYSTYSAIDAEMFARKK